MRLVFAGTPKAALPSLRALADSSHELVAVVTRPDAPVGRGRTLRPSPVKELALELGLEVLTPAAPSSDDFRARLTQLAPDACPVVAYGSLLPPAVLGIPARGWVNLHFSLLPAWRGAAPVQRAIIAGDDVTGASTFLIEAGLDTGPIFGQVTETIEARDTAGTLLERLSQTGARLLVDTMNGIADGTAVPIPQADHDVSLAPKLSSGDAQVRWDLPPHLIDRAIRGTTPEPGAWTTFRGERLGVGPTTPAGPDAPRLAPGALHADRRRVLVGTGGAPLKLGAVRPAGKKEMAADAWARGARIADGESLQWRPPAAQVDGAAGSGR